MANETRSPMLRSPSPTSSIDQPLASTHRPAFDAVLTRPTSISSDEPRRVSTVNGEPLQKDVVRHRIAQPAARHSKTKQEREAAAGGKAGAPGKFPKVVADAFEELLPAYMQIDKTTGAGKITRLKPFWYKATTTMWEHMSSDEARAHVDPRGIMQEDEVGSAIITSMKAWFKWKERVKGCGKNLFATVARESLFPKQQPRQKVVWQVYHRECGDLITEEYIRQGSSNHADRMATRNAIAQAQFSKLPEEQQLAFEQMAADEYEREMLSYNGDGREGGEEGGSANVEGAVTAEQQRQARARMSQALQPMFREISRLTGLENLTLLGGTAPDTADGNYLCMGLHYGESISPAGLNFSEFNPRGYADNVLGHWAEFVRSTSNVTCLQGAERHVVSEAPPKFTIELVDPYEIERQERAQELAAVENSVRKKSKKQKKRTKKSTPSPETPEASQAVAKSPVNSPAALHGDPRSLPGTRSTEDLPSTQTSISSTTGGHNNAGSSSAGPSSARRRAGLSTTLTENANIDLVNKVSTLEDDKRRRETQRLNGLSDAELACECEQALIEARARAGQLAPSDVPGIGEPLAPDGDSSSPARPIFSFLPAQGPFVEFNDGLDLDLLSTPPFAAEYQSSSAPPIDPAYQSGWVFTPYPGFVNSPVVAANGQGSAPAGTGSISVPDSALTPGVTAPPSRQTTQLSDTVVSAVPSASHSGVSPSTASTVGPQQQELLNAPEWVRAHYKMFVDEAAQGHVPDAWLRLASSWFALEKHTGFVTTRIGFSTRNRPAEIGNWIKHARDGRMTVVNEQHLYRDWTLWWTNINPEWRTRTDGRLVIGGSGEWKTIGSATGKNGLVNVLACLQALKEVTTYAEWVAEVNDVDWVLQELLTAKQGCRLKRTSPDSEPSERSSPRPAQRPRRA